MPHGRKRQKLDQWLIADLPRFYKGRVLPIDTAVADTCGRLLVKARDAGHTPELGDALLAATAHVHGLRMAMLNRRHFERLGVELVQF